MISFLWLPAPKACRLFPRLSTDHSEARTSTTAACRAATSMAQISPEHSPLHPLAYSSYSSPPSQTAQLAARGTPTTPSNVFKSP
jgi:hypothetical protein